MQFSTQCLHGCKLALFKYVFLLNAIAVTKPFLTFHSNVAFDICSFIPLCPFTIKINWCALPFRYTFCILFSRMSMSFWLLVSFYIGQCIRLYSIICYGTGKDIVVSPLGMHEAWRYKGHMVLFAHDIHGDKGRGFICT